MINIITLPNFYKCTNTTINYNTYYFELLNKALSLFKWSGLPDNIDSDMLEMFLLLKGHIAFFKYGDKLHASQGELSGELDENYTFTEYIITNPYITKSETLKFRNNSDCIVVYNTPADKQKIFNSVFNSMLKRTAGILSDNLSSLNCLQINSRVQTLVTADNSNIAKSAEDTLKEMYDGKPYKVVTSTLANNINIENKTNTNSNTFSELIDLHNYMYAQYLHSIGIMSNEVQKKERLIESEISENDIECNLNIDIMLKSRKKAVIKINEIFGTEISVEINDILKPKAEKEMNENATNKSEISTE